MSPGHWPQGPTHRSYCPVTLVSRTNHMPCVCTLVWMARAGFLAALGSLSIHAPTPLLLSRAGVWGAQVPPGWGLYLTLFVRRWVLAGVDVVWMWSGCCPVSSRLYSRKSCLCYIFIDICGLGRRFPLLYSHHHFGTIQHTVLISILMISFDIC